MTKRCPADFSELLSPKGKDILENGLNATQFAMTNKETPYISFTDALDVERSALCRDMLNDLWPISSKYSRFVPLPPDSHSDPNLDYVNCPYNSVCYQMTQPAAGATTDDEKAFFEDSGIAELTRSPALKAFAEQVTGYKLTHTGKDGLVVISYGTGGYVGPHTDVKWHHAAGFDNTARSLAYVDMHLIFATDAVEHQYLIAQDGAFMTTMAGGAPTNGTVSILRQPFWHASTPLKARPGQEDKARRWLLGITFLIEGDNSPKKLV